MESSLKIFRPFYHPLGADLFCFGKKFLVFTLVSRNLKIKYRDSIFGLLWTLLTPLAITAVYYFVFKIVLNIQIPHQLIFILSGVLTWSYISQSINEGLESIVGSIGIITKVPIPLQVFPFVVSVTNMVTFLISLIVLWGASYFSGIRLNSAVLILPIYGLALFLITYGFSHILALLFVRLRDLRHLTGILLQIWFYATPVIYDESMIPKKYNWVIYLNPFGYIFVDIHSIWIRQSWPAFRHLWVIGGWAILMTTLSAWFQKNYSRGLVEQI